MILNNAPQNEAILSNVGMVDSFKIKATAKSFSILSSGLYANKIRAIIRELSCNAYDSHIAAGKGEVPFDVHLPNHYEPWFTIRDYGTGLTHDQIVNIFTTFFESTKTGSNDFIGALGLGSKSPFSYTDNFTVTTIKDGWRGIYSAFINNEGVPSIALMMEDSTTEPNGVEVKMAVSETRDFYKFKEEASFVYRYFKLRPVVSGNDGFQFEDIDYETKDIIPGVHSMKRHYGSVAVMGNIAYELRVPNADSNLGDLADLLSCSLELHFDIGELDFQASREGLSYIPQTIEAIKKKLNELNEHLAVHVEEEANKIENLWERANFVVDKCQTRLWKSAAIVYADKAKLPTLTKSKCNGHYSGTTLHIYDKFLEECNITIRGFIKQSGYNSLYALKKRTINWNSPNVADVWELSVGPNVHWVINDTKMGATERAKYHWRNSSERNSNVYVLEPIDRKSPMLLDDFFARFHNPPNRINASDLATKPKKSTNNMKNVSIMLMNPRRENRSAWEDAGSLDKFDENKTYYYLPLSGFTVISEKYNIPAPTELHRNISMCGVADLANLTIYGVRKSNQDIIKEMENWVNLEDYIATTLANVDESFILNLIAKNCAS